MILPNPFREQMQAQLGADFAAFTEALTLPSPISLRLNARKLPLRSPIPNHIPWAADGYYLSERPFFTADPIFRAGGYYVQEASSMLLEQAIRQYCSTEQSMVLDLCAAPGGKSTHLLDLFSTSSVVVSNEVIGSRAKILKENIQKWGAAQSVVTNNDPAHFERLPNFFDVMVVDAPCSGEGMFRKLAHSIEEWSPSSVEMCAARQRRILADVWASLKPNGILIYSTCTYNAAENEENVQWAIDNLGATSLSLQLSTEQTQSIQEIKYKAAYNYRCYPHLVEGEGFAISILQKPAASIGKQKNKKSRRKVLQLVSKQDRLSAEPYLLEAEKYQLFSYQNTLHIFPKGYQEELELLVEQLRVIYFGTSCLEPTKKGWKPTPYFAFSNAVNPAAFDTAVLDWENAMKLMLGEAPELPDTVQGWVLCQYASSEQLVAIGLVKKIKQRINNYFPKEWKTKTTWERLSHYSNQKII